MIFGFPYVVVAKKFYRLVLVVVGALVVASATGGSLSAYLSVNIKVFFVDIILVGLYG